MIRRALRSEEGQALVEFSLVLPIVLLLLLGILQAGLILGARQAVENSARIAADTYAQTLSTSRADGEAAAAADHLRPRLVAPAAAITYAVIGETTQTYCVRRRGWGCRERGTRTVRNERGASAADRGAVGELVRASVRYDYPLPVGGLARFGLPTRVTLTGQAVSLIEAAAPAPAPDRARCYEVAREIQTFGNPIDVSVRVDGSPAARVRAAPGADVPIEIIVSPGPALRQYGLPALVPGPEAVRLGDQARTVAYDRVANWMIGGSTVNYRYRATITLRPAADGSCAAR